MTESSSSKTAGTRSVLIALVLLIAASALFFLIGKSSGEEEMQELCRLNRSELEVLSIRFLLIFHY